MKMIGEDEEGTNPKQLIKKPLKQSKGAHDYFYDSDNEEEE